MSKVKARIYVAADREAFVSTAAELVAQAAAEAIERSGRFVVALAGGRTPRPVYALLAERADLNWPAWRIFLSDERDVAPDHDDSNYRMVKESLLDKLRPPLPTVVRWPTEYPPDRAAAEYEEEIRRTFGNELPRFDLIMLGMGADGHTAGLFPGTAALGETRLLAAANAVPKLGAKRLTFTFPLLNRARRLLVLVSGRDKKTAFKAVVERPEVKDAEMEARYPIRRLVPSDGTLTWVVDQEAGRGVDEVIETTKV